MCVITCAAIVIEHCVFGNDIFNIYIYSFV